MNTTKATSRSSPSPSASPKADHLKNGSVFGPSPEWCPNYDDDTETVGRGIGEVMRKRLSPGASSESKILRFQERVVWNGRDFFNRDMMTQAYLESMLRSAGIDDMAVSPIANEILGRREPFVTSQYARWIHVSSASLFSFFDLSFSLSPSSSS